MLEYFTQIKFPDSFALIATISEDDDNEEIAVSRHARYPDSDAAEVAIVVADEWQGYGIGSRMLQELRSIVISAGIKDLLMDILPENTCMLRLAKELGFHLATTPNSGSESCGVAKSIEP